MILNQITKFQIKSHVFQIKSLFLKSNHYVWFNHDLNQIKIWICPSLHCTKYYFTNRVVNVWSSLPSHIVSSSTLSTFKSRLEKHHDFSFYLIEFTVYYVVYILVVFLSQVFLLVFLTICTVLFYFSVSCFVTVMAVLVTTLVLLLLINLDLDLRYTIVAVFGD